LRDNDQNIYWEQFVSDILPEANKNIKPLRIAIFVCVFLLFAIVGFFVIQQLAGLLFPKPPPAVATTSNALFINQGTLLLIHADQLASKQPQLISVWVVFISKTNPPSLIAKSIYPDIGSPEKSQQVAQSFNYTENTGLSPQFIKQIQDYDLQWNGYVIVDKVAFAQLAKWINGNQSSFNFSGDTSNSQAILEAEKAVFQESCKNLVKADSDRGDKPHWAELFPAHLETDLFFRDTAVNWDRVTLSNPAPDCKVLVTP
jgi:hypothetical protein